MKRGVVYMMLVSLLFFSCKGAKTVVGSTKPNSGLALKGIITAHEAAIPNFSTLASRVRVAYKDEKQKQSITVSLRMEKNQKIWVKASVLGITLAKALITPDRVSYYETLGNTYFDGDFALLSEWLGTSLDFEKTQAILLGQSIFELDRGKYQSSVSEDSYQLEPKRQPNNFIHSLLLRPENFKVRSSQLTQPADDRELFLTYGEYQELEGSQYPSQIAIRALEGTSETTIDVEFKKIDLNVSVKFPFSIPEGYEEIDLAK
ncbi:DUF4292 domain-containing protein [Aureisphaera galaxeae]|uniref:DUF4292 domain-containing protein n=1 Tax=Aureisphaera galaxeae TaxID=1538023 RepID=UPI00235099F9|nr:DUF4292 domain-containing protein [Aureisphaera galaxeae]MDC8005043.1 DUF4292 domain-containing protein [Aureisphaera galaxeae]